MESLINTFAMEVEREIINTIKSLAKRYKLDEREAYNYIMETNKEGGGKRGRPAKEKTEEENKVKGPRGRPPKEEKKVTTYVGEDLITRLLAKAKTGVSPVSPQPAGGVF
jgi:replication initiation and membrane attachment protein DnaB